MSIIPKTFLELLKIGLGGSYYKLFIIKKAHHNFIYWLESSAQKPNSGSVCELDFRIRILWGEGLRVLN